MGHEVCAHCGEVFARGKLVCPHCGTDADLTYAETPSEFEFRGPDTSYEEFLEREDLTPAAPRRRGMCGLLLAGPAISGLIWLLLL